jgi:transcriptional regulator with XRE-family HTH domain
MLTNRMKKTRNTAELPQNDVATKLGMHGAAIARYECSEHAPGVYTALRVAAVLVHTQTR